MRHAVKDVELLHADGVNLVQGVHALPPLAARGRVRLSGGGKARQVGRLSCSSCRVGFRRHADATHRHVDAIALDDVDELIGRRVTVDAHGGRDDAILLENGPESARAWVARLTQARNWACCGSMRARGEGAGGYGATGGSDDGSQTRWRH